MSCTCVAILNVFLRKVCTDTQGGMDGDVHNIICNQQDLETARYLSTVEWKSIWWYIYAMEHYATIKRGEYY